MTKDTLLATEGRATSRIVVTGSFTATHSCVEKRPHKHTWTVTAWFEPPARADATLYRAALDGLLETMDGTTLPADADWNEDIAARVGALCNCVRVRVWRQSERLGCEWIAPCSTASS